MAKQSDIHSAHEPELKDFSLHVLDIVLNSLNAGADIISVTVRRTAGRLVFTVTDNGCGMTDEVLRQAVNPGFTTNESGGWGLTLLERLARNNGGTLTIASDQNGTVVHAEMDADGVPMGDVPMTVKTLLTIAPETEFTFVLDENGRETVLSTAEMREVLDGCSVGHPDVTAWVYGMLTRETNEVEF